MEDVSKKLNRLMSRIKSKNTQDAIVSPAKMMITPMSIEQPEEFDFAVENRTIVSYIPLVDLVVQFDNNSKILKFKFDRYFDNVDLSQKSVNANFLNAEKNSGHTPCSITSIEENSFIVDWLIESELTTESGKIEYGLEFFEKDATENKIYVWQTKPSSFDIEDSLIILNDTIPTDYTRQRTFYEENNNSTNYLHLKDTGAIIQIDNRTILIGEYSDLAIQQDNLSQILSFKISRYFQNTDLSTKLITIGYVNALGQSDMSTAVNVKLSQLEIEFSWVLDSKVTQKDGSVQFFVSFIGYDEFDKFYLWNTKTATLNIERGLLISDSIEEPEPSWVQSILLDMNLAIQEIKNTAVADMEKETDTVIAETKEAIELTKTATQGALNAVSDLAATALRTSASRWTFHADGNPVVVNPAAGSPMEVVADRDCTLQHSGVNIADALNADKYQRANTEPILISGNKITVTSIGETLSRAVLPIYVIPNTDYTLHASARMSAGGSLHAGGADIYIRESSGGGAALSGQIKINTDGSTVSGTVKFNSGSLNTVWLWLYVKTVESAGTRTMEVWDVQVERGNTFTSWEPFVANNIISLQANTPTEIKAIQGENHLFADNSAWLQVAFNRDSMSFLNTDLTVPVSATGPIAEIDGCIGGLPLDVTVRAIATQEGMGDPSPTNVRPIVGLDDIYIAHIRKHNILSVPSASVITQNGITFTNYGDGSYRMQGTNTSAVSNVIYYDLPVSMPLQKGMDYTVSLNNSGINGSVSFAWHAMNKQLGYVAPTTASKTVKFVAPLQSTLITRISLFVGVGVTIDITFTPQIELGAVGHSFEPFVGHTYPIALPEPLYGLVGAEDDVDIRRGIGVRRTGYKAYTQSQPGTWNVPHVGINTIAFHTGSQGFNRTGYDPAICTHFKWTGTDNFEEERLFVSSNILHIRIFKSRLIGYEDGMTAVQIVALFINWISAQESSGTPLAILYQTATPQPFTFPPVIIPSLPSLNTVFSDAGGDTTITGQMGLQGFVKRLEALEALTTQP